MKMTHGNILKMKRKINEFESLFMATQELKIYETMTGGMEYIP